MQTTRGSYVCPFWGIPWAVAKMGELLHLLPGEPPVVLLTAMVAHMGRHTDRAVRGGYKLIMTPVL